MARRVTRRESTTTVDCIYCGADQPVAREHAIPRTLGTYRGLETLRSLCRGCNQQLGALDQIFARTAPEALFRHIAGVTGRRRHRAVNPFYYHLTEQGGLRALGKHPEYPFDVLWEVEPGTRHVREARQIIFRVRGKYEPIALPETGFRAFLEDQIRRRNLVGAEPVCFFCGDSENDRDFLELKDALDALCEKGTMHPPAKMAPGHVVTTRVEFGITRDYLRAIAKVAFHYFLTQQRQYRYRGSEPTFEAVRRFISAGENFDGQCRLVPSITEEVLRGGGTSRWTHFLTGEITDDELAVRVQLFVGPDTAPPAWRVRLGRNPSPIHQAMHAFGHKFVLFDKQGADGYQGEMLPLTAATMILKPDVRAVAMVERSRVR